MIDSFQLSQLRGAKTENYKKIILDGSCRPGYVGDMLGICWGYAVLSRMRGSTEIVYDDIDCLFPGSSIHDNVISKPSISAISAVGGCASDATSAVLVAHFQSPT
jgi:hypothetical protein